MPCTSEPLLDVVTRLTDLYERPRTTMVRGFAQPFVLALKILQSLCLVELQPAIIPAATGRPGYPSGDAAEAVRLRLHEPHPVPPPA